MAHIPKLSSVALAVTLLLSLNLLAQNALGGEVVLTKLAPPIYPPLAREARISGDVVLMVEIRPNGSVASTSVVAGHPLLVQAALDSAKQSQFECRNCSEDGISYRLVYSFGLDASNCSATVRGDLKRPPRLTQAVGHVTIIDVPVCVDHGPLGPGVIVKPDRARSGKCLWLWKCGPPRVIGIP